MKITADQTRELLQLLVEVDGQSKAAAKQVFNGITPDGRLALARFTSKEVAGEACAGSAIGKGRGGG
ncbi:TPA: hypothetical protein ACRNJ0_006553 [Pseudomonas aeruginosa]